MLPDCRLPLHTRRIRNVYVYVINNIDSWRPPKVFQLTLTGNIGTFPEILTPRECEIYTRVGVCLAVSVMATLSA